MQTYRQIHTTSTKCQYHAAASSLKWCVFEKWVFRVRTRLIDRNRVPIITWTPWKPVDMKKIDPYTLSAIVNGASLYSVICRKVKYAPRLMVSIRDIVALFCFFARRQ